jgi:O-methyltransferase involved in polyketide biosynthesis
VAHTALVVTEGLLIYLTEPQVASLGTALHAVPSIRWWIADVASPQLLQIMHKMWGRSVAAGNAPFQFAPADSAAFFAASGWREIVFRSAMHEAHRLRREMRFVWIWRFLGRFGPPAKREAFRRMSGYILLERA